MRYGLAQEAAGLVPTNEVLVPGVLTFDAYKTRMATWDEVRKCIGLWGQFWEGASALLYPPAWLNEAELRIADNNEPFYMGIDPGEGGDDTSWAVINRSGLKKLLSKSTPDTTVIPNTTIQLMTEFNIKPEHVVFDAGGGGKQHADWLRSRGMKVRTVRFGESVSLDPKRGLQQVERRMDTKEDKYTFVNRRAEMAHELSQLIDPTNEQPFALPKDVGNDSNGKKLSEKLRHQMSMIPNNTDAEGRFILPPKRQKPGSKNKDEVTLVSIIGYSPNEWDALMCAGHAMLHQVKKILLGAG